MTKTKTFNIKYYTGDGMIAVVQMRGTDKADAVLRFRCLIGYNTILSVEELKV